MNELKKKSIDLLKKEIIELPLKQKVIMFSVILQTAVIIADNFGEEIFENKTILKKCLNLLTFSKEVNLDKIPSNQVEDFIKLSEYIDYLVDAGFDKFLAEFEPLVGEEGNLNDFPTGKILLDRISENYEFEGELENKFSNLPEEEFGFNYSIDDYYNDLFSEDYDNENNSEASLKSEENQEVLEAKNSNG